MAYDPYKDIPDDLRPTTLDAVVLTEVVRLVKEAVALRHDFHTAIKVSDRFASIRQQFTPRILLADEPQAQRHLGSTPPWESAFASAFPWCTTVEKFAERHVSIALEAKTRAMQLVGNAKLSALVKQNLQYFLPEIGYSSGSGSYLRRLRKDDRTILSAFNTMGVGDVATLIGLMSKNQKKMTFYW